MSTSGAGISYPQADPPGCDPADNVWKNEDGRWLTSFPPQAGFDAWQNAAWDGFNYYERACTPEEAELLDADQAAAEAREFAEATAFAEAKRDKFFQMLGARSSVPGKANLRLPFGAAADAACGKPPEQAQSPAPSQGECASRSHKSRHPRESGDPAQ